MILKKTIETKVDQLVEDEEVEYEGRAQVFRARPLPVKTSFKQLLQTLDSFLAGASQELLH